MKIYIGADHRGASLAHQIYEELKKESKEVVYSSLPTTPDDDYPDFAFEICQKVLESKDNLGILLCGNGIGISIAANKVKQIRCARVVNEEEAHHARNHNGANVIAFGGVDFITAMNIVNTFLNTPNPTESRHLKRIEKIIKYEEGTYYEL